MSRFHKVLVAWLTCFVFGWIMLSPTVVGQDNNSPDQSAQIVQCVEDSMASSGEIVAPSTIIVIPRSGECHTFKPRLYYVRSANDLQEIRSQSDVPDIGDKRILLLIHGWNPGMDGKDEVRCQYDPLLLACIVSPDAPKDHIIKTWDNFINFFYYSDAAKTLRNHFALFAVRYNSNNHPYDGGQSSNGQLDTTYGAKPSGQQLAELLDYLGNREQVIVAYSMGGLVARSYMAEYGGVSRTLGLITLGTPHHGSVFAGPRRVLATRPRCLSVIGSVFAFLFTNTPGANDLAWDNAPGLRQFDNHENDELLALNSSTIPETDSKTVAFYGTIERGGHGRLGFTDGCLKAIGFQRSDGVVVEESGRNSGASLANTIHFRDYNHSQMLKGKGNDKCLDGVTATSRSPCLFVKIRDQICTFANLSCVNRPPIANAGPDQTMPVNSIVQLDGRGSFDPDGDEIKSYQWTILPRENSARCIFRTSNRIVDPKVQPRREGSCTIELQVTDARGARSVPDQVVITVRQDITPPGLIQNFQASDNEDSRSTLTWTHPSDSDLAEIIVRCKLGSYPTNHNDSDLVYQNASPTPGAAVTHTDTGLTNGTTYYYAVFSRDRSGNWNDQVIEGKNADTGRPSKPWLTESPWPMFLHDPQHTARSAYVGPSTSNLKWTFTFDDPLNAPPQIPSIGIDGTIYIAYWAINPHGSLKFKAYVNYFDAPAIASDGTLYVNYGNYYLYALLPDGTVKWRIDPQTDIGTVRRSVTLGPDGTVYTLFHYQNSITPPISYTTKLFAVTPEGAIKWIYEIPHFATQDPVVDSDGRIYVTTGFGLFAINPDGTLKWKLRTVSSGDSPTIDVINRTIYVAGDLGLWAVGFDGSLKWKISSVRGSTVGLGKDGTIYVIGATDSVKGLHAITPEGTIKWSYAISGERLSYIAIDDLGTIFMSASSDGVYAINSDGTLKWKYPLQEGTLGSPIITEGTLYVSHYLGENSKLYAFGSSPSEWGEIIPSSENIGLKVKTLSFSEGIKFLVDPTPLNIKVEVFDLVGRIIFHTDWVSNSFEWNLLNNRGQRLANGVYLYVVTIRKQDGTILRSQVKKLVILR